MDPSILTASGRKSESSRESFIEEDLVPGLFTIKEMTGEKRKGISTPIEWLHTAKQSEAYSVPAGLDSCSSGKGI